MTDFSAEQTFFFRNELKSTVLRKVKQISNNTTHTCVNHSAGRFSAKQVLLSGKIHVHALAEQPPALPAGAVGRRLWGSRLENVPARIWIPPSRPGSGDHGVFNTERFGAFHLEDFPSSESTT